MVDIKEGFSSLLGGFNFSAILDKIYLFTGIFLLCLVVGGLIFGILYARSRDKKNKDIKRIQWWEETNQGLIPTRMDDAEEIVIPGTALRVFYVKARDLWLPRFTRGMTKDLFFVAMTPNRQMVNFSLKSLGKTLEEANLMIDHTDMLWAAENTREFIKRNYKDKSIKWWQAYQGVITTAIFILILTFSFILILYMLKGVVDKIGGLLSTATEAMKMSCQNAFNSGIVPAS
jgi:hypothetical protein